MSKFVRKAKYYVSRVSMLFLFSEVMLLIFVSAKLFYITGLYTFGTFEAKPIQAVLGVFFDSSEVINGIKIILGLLIGILIRISIFIYLVKLHDWIVMTLLRKGWIVLFYSGTEDGYIPFYEQIIPIMDRYDISGFLVLWACLLTIAVIVVEVATIICNPVIFFNGSFLQLLFS